jgi:hypothetical protein
MPAARSLECTYKHDAASQGQGQVAGEGLIVTDAFQNRNSTKKKD